MKCISKRKKAAALLGVFVIGLTGCTSKEVVLENAYDVCDICKIRHHGKWGIPVGRILLQGI